MKKVFLTLCVMGVLFVSHSVSAQDATAAATTVSDTTALKEYAGKYKFEGLPFDYIYFSLKDGVLNIQAGDQGGPMTQDKATPEKFEAAEGQAKIAFVRDDNKKVAKVTIDYQGMLLEGKKED
ncbi:MAG: hypothetical protein MUE30_08940 [Spirosomaceae bacterium]|jgi:hypothetical protein|nr:hypothetical protein [Spirosomataceae bacterium]